MSNDLLRLQRVVVDVLLRGRRGRRCVLRGDLAHLRGLLVDDAAGVLDLRVDHLLVLLVDQRRQEEQRRRDQREAPEWHDLDEVVGEEGAEEGLATG